MNVNKQQGFVMVAAIWLTLIMLVFAGLFGFYASNQLDKALLAKTRIDEHFDRAATEQTLLYLFSTGRGTRAGLVTQGAEGEALKLDGTVYRGFGDVRFAANDHAGLVGLNVMNNYHLNSLLQKFETSGLKRQALTHALYDYIDIDERVHLNGKEAPAYRVANLELPPNDYLKTPVELDKVYGWSAWLQSHPEFNVGGWLSSNWRSRINLNTMPEELFEYLLPISESDAERLVERRMVTPFTDLGDVLGVLNHRAVLDEDYYTFIPTGSVRFRIFSANNRKMSTITIFFTPLSTSSAWLVDYRYQSERNFDIAEPSGLVAAEYFGRELSAAETEDRFSAGR